MGSWAIAVFVSSNRLSISGLNSTRNIPEILLVDETFSRFFNRFAAATFSNSVYFKRVARSKRRRVYTSETAAWLYSKIPMVPSYLINSIINHNKREKQSELATKTANPMDSRYTKHFHLGCVSAIASASVRVLRNKVSAVYLRTSCRRGEFVPLRGRNCRR